MSGLWRALVDTCRGALATLGANKLRSALTLLGIVIGVLAVVAMAATIEGLRKSISADLSQLGSGVFQVQRDPRGGGHFGGGRDWQKYARRKRFTMAHVELLQDKCTQCLHVAGEAWSGGQTVTRVGAAGMAQSIAVVGGTTYFMDNNGYALASGRVYTDGEIARGADVAIIGADVVDALFPNDSPLDQRIVVQGHTYKVIGTMDRRGSSFDGSMDSLITIPLPAFLSAYGRRQSLHVTIAARDPERLEEAQDEVVALLRRARGTPPQAENDFELFSNDSVQEEFAQMAAQVATVTIGVCAIALLIGGIGVMNIMLVAVTERTSEIGVRRALGARRRRILAQFVLEAVLLCAAGGLIGILLGSGVAALVEVFVQIPTEVPSWAVALSLTAASGVGLVFGIYPAWRASRLDPVEAMRQE